ncbi:EAL domain, c-di-GMP-specific phosphodiesterase class I (or its enzymatically inactive variant) [Roseivivax lentus]|uniref:EAL domain, c-di-GMP-specific phosphodiesterase class I (Or its enzymatically inactive variant) n=1 Tax=Roseivivax lentus TaxID=633194 RepID=A0A1N7KC99_9RHOB|nr:EAL domain-containing protein [Roseivivax lentus]SIS59192.1 EAL domain, c-di-GMP-specific phosphodiesterase class I (or its enzymatically inactive variant) [Roseivivax lentus]
MVSGLDISVPKNALDFAVRELDRDTPRIVENAVRARNVNLAFQPVVQSAAHDRVAFYEGLARVLDPAGRIIPARDFIRDIEEQETGRLLDCVALSKGLGILSRNPDIRLSLNLSARSIGYRKYTNILEQALTGDPTIADRLILEVTEPSAMLVPELVSDFMRRYGPKGITFALDNFGATATNLRVLSRFTFDILKIDGRLTRGAAEDADTQVLLRAILAMAREFDVFTIAESIESQDDAQFMTDIGIDCLQGFYFAAPTLDPPWRRIGSAPV